MNPEGIAGASLTAMSHSPNGYVSDRLNEASATPLSFGENEDNDVVLA